MSPVAILRIVIFYLLAVLLATVLGGLAQADALAVSDAETDEVSAGSEVELILLRPRREIDGRLEGETAAGSAVQ